MNKAKAFGTFVKQNGKIYRTSAYLQWGNSEDIIGAVVMSNPGAARLKDVGNDFISSLIDENEQFGEIEIDPTLKQIKLIVEGGYNISELNGRVLVYNLFTLQNTDMKESTNSIKDLKAYKSILFKNFSDFELEYKKIPFTLIAFGCERNKCIEEEKNKWLKFITDNKIMSIGIQGKNCNNYYHPLPPNIHKQREFREEIINQLRLVNY